MTTLRRFFAVVVMVAAAAATPNSGDGQGLYAPATLRTFALTFHDVDWLARLRSNDALETNILADRVVDGVSYPSVGVRMRGNTPCNGCWLRGRCKRISGSHYGRCGDATLVGGRLLDP